MAEFFVGVVCGVVGLFLIAAIASPDTPRTISERGFFTYADQLFVVRPAEPAEIGE